MTFPQRRNRLTTHFLERIPVVKRLMTVLKLRITSEIFIPLSPTELAGGSENTLLCGGQISVRLCWCLLAGLTVLFWKPSDVTVRNRANSLRAQCQGAAISATKNMATLCASWRQASTYQEQLLKNYLSQSYCIENGTMASNVSTKKLTS